MTAKVKNLMNELVKRETLEQGGDDAYNALDDKNTWFARRYIRDKDNIIDRIQNMLILGIYPKKEYKEVDIVSENKARKICPMHIRQKARKHCGNMRARTSFSRILTPDIYAKAIRTIDGLLLSKKEK